MLWSSSLCEMKPRPWLLPAFSIRPSEVALFGLIESGSGEPRDEACSTKPIFRPLFYPLAACCCPLLDFLLLEDGLELFLTGLIVFWCSMKPSLEGLSFIAALSSTAIDWSCLLRSGLRELLLSVPE